ncbi:MAG TPA: DUF350 domain-containing protein [Candidatus Saccharimonadales bacterium]|jgi:uncharacterized membrane protein YjfL (UPF0719 family)
MTYLAASLPVIDQLALFGWIAAYTFIGVSIMLFCIAFCNYFFKLDLRKELIHDHNTAFGIMLAGLFIAVSIIVAASILG